MPETISDKKMCVSCKELLPIEEFGVLRSSYDGYNKFCKACNRHASSKSYHKRALNPKPRVVPRIALPLKEKNQTTIASLLSKTTLKQLKIPFNCIDLGWGDKTMADGKIIVKKTDFVDMEGKPSSPWTIEFWWRNEIESVHRMSGTIDWIADLLAFKLANMRMVVLEDRSDKKSE